MLGGRKMYYAQCAYVDYEVGRMMKFLDKYKLRRNTVCMHVLLLPPKAH